MPRSRFRSANVARPWPGEGIFGFLVTSGDVSCHCPPWGELAFLFPARPAAGGAGHRVAAAVASILSANSNRRSFPG